MGYLALVNANMMLEMIKEAVETVGPQNFDSQALYAAAQSYSRSIDGITRYSYGESKRFPTDFYGIYVASVDDQDIVRVDPAWYPTILEP